MVACPCCNQAVAHLTPELIVASLGLTPMEGRVLRAIWNGKGQPVPSARVFERMFCDRDGDVLSKDKLYLAFKVTLCRVRRKIKGSGVGIENVGYNAGYRLIFDPT